MANPYSVILHKMKLPQLAHSACRLVLLCLISAALCACQVKGAITHLASLGSGSLTIAPPSSLTLVTPASSPGTVTQPVIQVGGVISGNTAKIFSDSTCSTLVGTAVVSTTPTVNIALSAPLTIGAYTFYANSSDTLGNTSACSTASLPYTLSSISPIVTGVTSTLANGSYTVGQVIPIKVTFSSAVTVTGTPQITVALTPANKAINYASGSGTTTLTFNYTVAGTDTSAALDYVATTSLALNGGTIQDVGANSATLTLPAPAAAGSLSANKTLVIDTTAPNVPSALALVTPASSPSNNQTPTIQVSGVTNTDLVTLYSDSSCTIPISSATASSGATVNITTSSLAAGVYTIYASSADPAGNTSACSVATLAYTVNLTGPTVTNVTSSTANGSYKAAQAISIQVVFSSAVTVTGTPQLALNTGRTVNYASGTGTNTLTFTYTVQAGDTSADLDYAATTSLTLNGGTIQDALTNNATLTLAVPGAANSLGANKNIVIDTTAPGTPSGLSLVTPASSPSNNQTPTIQVTGVANTDLVTLYSDSGCTTAISSATASVGATVNITANAMAAGAYTIYAKSADPAGNLSSCSVASLSYTINLTGPTVTNVTSSTANGAYKAAQAVSIQVVFSSIVNVTGTPQIALNTVETVDYVSGTGTNTLTFTYTVQPGDTSADLDYVATNSLTLNGGTIQDALTNNATLTLAVPGAANSLGANKNIVIDTTAPGVPSALTLVTPASSPSNNQTPTIHVAGVANTDLVTLYSDSSCTAAISSATAAAGATVNITTNSLAAAAYTIYAKSADPAGNTSTCSVASLAYTVDLTAPTVTNVTSSTANGTYKATQAVSIQVVFSKAVTVTGTPQLTLGTTPNETVNYASGTGTTSLTFTYTVQAGDNSADLDYAATTSLTLNGGTIVDAAGNAATLTLAAPAAAGSLGANKNIVIDTLAPNTPNSLVLTTPASSPGTNATPVITVGAVVAGDIVTLYTDFMCAAPISVGTTSAGATVAVTTNALAVGAYTFYAQAVDAVGNASACSTANVSYTYNIPIGAFTISGITGPGDAVQDSNLNAGLLATVTWSAAANATDYDVTIYDSAGSVVVCPLQNTAATNYTFGVCTLTAGTTYKAKVTANKGAASLDASNSMYTFLVNRNPVAATVGPLYIMTNGSIAVNVVATATDADAGETLVIGTVGAPSHGSTTNTATTITYTPTASYTGADSFTYTITDSHGGTGTGTVNVSMMTAFTWTGASGVDNHWSTANNWCGSTKVDHTGCNGGAAPGNGDLAIFDGTCTSNCSAHITSGIDVGGINLNAGYTGTVTQDNGNGFTIESTGYSQAAGTFVGSSAGDGITNNGPFALSGGTFTNTSGTWTQRRDFTVTNAPTFSANSGTINYSNGCGGITITPGTIAYNNIAFAGGCPGFSLSGGTMSINGTMTMNAANGNFDNGTLMLYGDYSNPTGGPMSGSVVIQIAGNAGGQTLTGVAGSIIPNLVIAAGAHPVTFSGEIGVINTYTFTSASSLTAAGSTLVLGRDGSCNASSITPGAVTYNNVTLRGGCPNFSFNNGTMTVAGTLSILTAQGNLNSGTLVVNGDVVATSGSRVYGSAIVQVAGNAGGQTITGTSGSSIPHLEIAAGAHPVTFSGTIEISQSYTFTSASSLTAAGSTLNLGAAQGCTGISVVPGAVAYNNVTFKGDCNTFDFGGGTMTVNGNLSLGMGGGCNLNSGTVNVAGDVTATSGAPMNGSGVIQLTGNAGGQTVTGTLNSKLPALSIATGANAVTLSGTVAINGNYTWTSSGAFTTAGSTLALICPSTVTPGTVSYNNVTLDTACSVPSITTSFTIGGDLTVTSGGQVNMPNPGGAYTLAVTGTATNSAVINLHGASFTHGALTNTGTINP
jgi:formylmethanofuran dehydrogenase subunit C